MRELFLLCALSTMTGCTMIPKYHRPASPVAESFPGGGDHAGLASDIRWRDFFVDPRLLRLVELSLANNRNLRVAILTVQQYQAQYRVQRAALFPTIDATGGYTIAHADHATTSQYSVTVGTTAYELDLFGRVRSLKRQALEKYLASDETRRSTEIALVAQVATQYLVCVEDGEQLALARQTLASVQASYDTNKLGFENGVTTALDLSIAEAQVQTARVNVLEYERLAAQANNYLVLQVGEPLPGDLPAGRSLAEQGTFTDLPEGLPSELIARRPDILAAEHTLLAANANIGAARAAFFPIISLTASGGVASASLTTLMPSAAVWTFGPSISLPLFTGGANLANLDYAKVTKRVEIANYELAIQTAFREVADALVARGRYVFETTAQEKLVAAEQRRYDLTNLRYGEGVSSYLTVLLAQQDLYTSQSDLITLRVNRLANLITLYKALGGGWR